MENEYKEIEHQLRKTLEVWSDVMNESNHYGWGIYLDFSVSDAFNAVNIMSSVCANIGIKNGNIKKEKDAEQIGKNIKHFIEDNFGIDFNKLEKNE